MEQVDKSVDGVGSLSKDLEGLKRMAPKQPTFLDTFPATIVVNKYNHEGTDRDTNIMRPGPWGNPFCIGIHGTREVVMEMHMLHWRAVLRENPNALNPLRGRVLVCCCKPYQCHGDNYVQLLGEIRETAEKGEANV